MNACIYTQDRFKERVIFINFDQNLLKEKDSLRIRGGAIFEIAHDSSDSSLIYKLDFHSVKGGRTIFLGKEIKVSNGYQDKRLDVFLKYGSKREYSINELMGMNKIRIDTFEVVHIVY